MDPVHNQSDQGFPLSSLFIVMALLAIPLAMIGSIAGELSGSNHVGLAFASVPVAFFTMSITGMVIGLHQFRKMSGMLLGGAIGGLFGAMAGALVLAKTEATPRLMIMSAIGSVALVVLSVVIRALSHSTPAGDAVHPLDGLSDDAVAASIADEHAAPRGGVDDKVQ